MMRLSPVLLIATLLTTGCGNKKPTPESVYRQFHRSMTKYAREPYPGYRSQAYELLSEPSKALFKAQAEKVNASLPEGVKKLEPDQLLRVRHLTFDAPIKEVDTLEPVDDRVELEVTYETGKDEPAREPSRVSMIREADGWRVDLVGALDPSR